MANGSTKPVIFISYSHRDEPEKPADGEEKWLTFVQDYLGPAVKNGVFDLWVDRHMPGGTKWDAEIENKLCACDVFILLVSAHSMSSNYIVDKEIAIIRERQANRENVHFYPILLTPTPKAGLDKVNDKNLRPRDAKPLSGYSPHDRKQHMTDAANEIADIVEEIAKKKAAAAQSKPRLAAKIPVEIATLPETPYVNLVGRDAQLAQLDAAWNNDHINIISAVAEGGAGKSSLVNEWLVRLQQRNYGGAAAVFGWSFFSQGSQERITSADGFLDWAVARLGLAVSSNTATAKAEAIAEALASRRLLLVLDGVEPLQQGPGHELGKLKDQGLRTLLLRYVTTPPAAGHGLIVITSRATVTDIDKWRKTAAPVIDLDELSEDAGAALLKDNGVWGTDKDLKATVAAFGGHALGLSLLAGYLKETQNGDVRLSDHIRQLVHDPDNPRHDHARRVMESYAKEWLSDDAVLNTVMQLVGLFDRPADAKCLDALRREPTIEGLTEPLESLSQEGWNKAVNRLREARLLLPMDRAAPDSLDAHPLVREWFGERVRQTNENAWREAHGRLYEHLRDTTKEGDEPKLEDLAPLYQAIAHGCRAGRHQEARAEIYRDRICRRLPDGSIEFYASKKLGAFGSDLAAISWFFDKLYETPVAALTEAERSWALSVAAYTLRAQGRFAEALPAMRIGLGREEKAKDWHNAAITASNLSEAELLTGEVAAAVASAALSVEHANRSGDESRMIITRTTHADALHAAGRRDEAEALFADTERGQREFQPGYPLLYSLQGYQYCDLWLAKSDWAAARDRATQTIEWGGRQYSLLSLALDVLTVGRAQLGLALAAAGRSGVPAERRQDARNARTRLDEAVDGLRAAGTSHHMPRGLLARAAFRRSVGDWDGAARDLDEVEETAEPGPMRLFLCDMALERARLAFAKIEAFAPLNGMLEKDNPDKPAAPSAEQITALKQEAAKQLAIAADYIKTCGYHKRDEELAELQAVLKGEKTFAELPPRV
jgi:hypothetical protein